MKSEMVVLSDGKLALTFKSTAYPGDYVYAERDGFEVIVRLGSETLEGIVPGRRTFRAACVFHNFGKPDYEVLYRG
jgi:hypothetical protein